MIDASAVKISKFKGRFGGKKAESTDAAPASEPSSTTSSPAPETEKEISKDGDDAAEQSTEI